MKKNRGTAKPMIVRFYKREREAIKSHAKVINKSEAEVVRRAVQTYLYAY